MKADRGVAQLDRQVREALQECGLTWGSTLVVAVSGGPDSLAMLYALCNIKGEFGLKLHGAHLDHGLRGDASAADAEFVAETFSRLGIGLTRERADVASFQKMHRLSTEEAAREVRYAFLARVASECRADSVALGHTSDDQAETVLMHIIRGSGLIGLRGMEPCTRRTIGGREVLLVRPLLRISRKITSEYCRALNLEPRRDESNLSTDIMRNRIRIKLLPVLEEYNPAVREALIRLSRSAADEMEHLDREVDRIWSEAVRQEGGAVALNKEAVLGLAPALQTHLLRRAVATVKGDLREIDRNHIDDMARLMNRPAGRSIHLPSGIRFSVGYAEATITTPETQLCPLPELDGEHPLIIPGKSQVNGWQVTATLVEQGPGGASGHRTRPEGPPGGEDVYPEDSADVGTSKWYGPDGMVANLGHHAVGDRLWVRARRPGDRLQPLGMSGPKKLQDFMVDAKIPRQWRDRVPLVLSPKGIAWVVGWRIADWARVDRGEQRVLDLRFLPPS